MGFLSWTSSLAVKSSTKSICLVYARLSRENPAWNDAQLSQEALRIHLKRLLPLWGPMSLRSMLFESEILRVLNLRDACYLSTVVEFSAGGDPVLSNSEYLTIIDSVLKSRGFDIGALLATSGYASPDSSA